jgi:DNA-binding response OmpR family regulator
MGQVKKAWDGAAKAIILVESDAIRRVVTYFLQTSGVTATIAANGQSAANALHSGVPQLLITDRILPPWPGLGRITEAKSRHGALRVAMVEDSTSSDVARQAGVDVMLSMPVLRHEILECLPNRGGYCAPHPGDQQSS